MAAASNLCANFQKLSANNNTDILYFYSGTNTTGISTGKIDTSSLKYVSSMYVGQYRNEKTMYFSMSFTNYVGEAAPTKIVFSGNNKNVELSNSEFSEYVYFDGDEIDLDFARICFEKDGETKLDNYDSFVEIFSGKEPVKITIVGVNRTDEFELSEKMNSIFIEANKFYELARLQYMKYDDGTMPDCDTLYENTVVEDSISEKKSLTVGEIIDTKRYSLKLKSVNYTSKIETSGASFDGHASSNEKYILFKLDYTNKMQINVDSIYSHEYLDNIFGKLIYNDDYEYEPSYWVIHEIQPLSSGEIFLWYVIPNSVENAQEGLYTTFNAGTASYRITIR